MTMRIEQGLLDAVAMLAREAGAAIMAIYQRDFSVLQKVDSSPLTEADTASHGVIVTGLAGLQPLLPVLSEEGVQDGFMPGPGESYWLVDPLDGTKEFIKRNGEFSVNIALIHAGRPVLGVVFAPALDVMYLAAEGLGAFKQSDGVMQALQVASHQAGQAWRVVGSRSHAGDSLMAWLARLGEHELVPMGSSLKFCLVAEGVADVYPRLGPTSLWDTAAAQCVLEQAGGKVLRLDGLPLAYGDVGQLLNPSFVAWGGCDG